MKTSARLEAVRRTAFDVAVARLGGGRLTRADGVTYLETDGAIECTVHQLALAGVRVVPCQQVPTPAAGQRAAIGLDLTPFDRALPAVDIVEVHCLALGEASAALMRRRLPWLPLAHAARANCLRLLRDEDTVLAWRRVVWCSIATLRASRSLHVRPIVFDPDALLRHRPRWTYASGGAIERWAFA